MSGVEKDASQPKAIIHKRILESAADNPEVPMSAIANSVSGATVDLVEKVLSEYGDPAEQGGATGQPVTTGTSSPSGQSGAPGAGGTDDEPVTDSPSLAATTDGGPTTHPSTSTSSVSATTDVATEGTEMEGDEPVDEDEDRAVSNDHRGDETMSTNGTDETIVEPHDTTDTDGDSAELPGEDQLSGAQLDTLRAVYHRPGATQADIADALGVTRATVSRRLNDIEGFEWRSRASLAERLLPGSLDEEPGSSSAAPNRAGAGETVEGHDPDGSRASGDTGSAQADIDDLQDRMDAVEARVDEAEATTSTDDPADPVVPAADGTPDLDAGLVHKVLSACMDSEMLDEAEEQRLVECLMGYQSAAADRE